MLTSNIFRTLDDVLYQPMVWPYHSHIHKRPNMWTATIALEGFEPSEVSIKEDVNDKKEAKIVIHAKHEAEDDFSEVRKAVKIPDNVDRQKLKTIFGKEGLLILKAPYKEMTHENNLPLKINRVDTWNGVWGEMARLNDHMQELIGSNDALRFPRTEFIADKDGSDAGVWRVHINIGKDFKADEVKLRNHKNYVQLEAKREVSGDNGVSSRYLSETVSIPDGVEQDQLKSRLFDNGDLVLEAPCKKVPSVTDNREGRPIAVETGKLEDCDRMTVDN